MLYTLVKPFAAVGIRAFFRKIYLSNQANIPRGVPVILAANHPTAFLEPCILASHLDQPLYFLVRGDIFKHKVYARLLHMLHMLPVYRRKDRGFGYVRENYQTFEACYDALYQRKALMILAEGTTLHEKRLRPLQKGVARIAFGTLKKYPDLTDVYVVPVGVNYTQANRFRSDVMIDFGQPMRARDYAAAVEASEAGGMDAFTTELAKRLAERIIIIQDPKDDELAEYLLVMHRSEHPRPMLPVVMSTDEALLGEKRLTEALNKLPEDTKLILLAQADGYFSALKQHQISDRALVHPQGRGMWLLAGLPPAAAGYLFHLPVLKTANTIADTRVKHIEFYSSVKLGVAVLGGMFYYLLWLMLAGALGQAEALMLLLAMPLMGYVAVLWHDEWEHQQAVGRVKMLSDAERQALANQREELAGHARQWISGRSATQ